MRSFTLQLFDIRKHAEIENVVSFVGQDASGGFGILPGHAPLMTVLVFGLARFRRVDKSWEYLAMPGAVLYFADSLLRLVCRHYLLDSEYERISRKLLEEIVAEEDQLREVKQSLQNMEEALFKQLWDLRRQGVTPA